MRFGVALLFGLGAALLPQAALAKCQVDNFAELKVAINGRKALTDGEINGHPVRFIVDSGAFYSTLSPAIAHELKLALRDLPPNFQLRGIGGSTGVSIAQVRELKLAQVPISDVTFLVGGSDTGTAGLIGQNVLGLHDVEYDLEHGAVRLMHARDCDSDTNMAYWAGSKPISVLPIEARDQRNPHTIGTVLVNGVKMRAVFDTGAGGTVITPAAAKRAGVTADSPGVVAAGYARGLGTREVPTWRAPFDSIELGGEKLRHVTLAMHDLGGDTDMLVGIDFFLSHRVFVVNSAHRMFFTYDGGPVFGVEPTRAVTATGETIAMADTGQTPTDAAGFAARGTAFASKRDFTSALADLDRAVQMAPGEARYLYQRAEVRLALRQPVLAYQDLGKAVSLAPADADIRLAHGRMALTRGDRAAAVEDAGAADAALAPEAPTRLTLAGLYGAMDNPEAALASYDQWLRFHDQDGRRPTAFNGRCWARAVLNRDLDKALSDCNAANRLQPNTAAYLDSRGFVHLRRGENQAAVDDYSAALAISPNLAWARYQRGIAETRLGQNDAGRQDMAAAEAVDPRVKGRATTLGL